MSLNNICASRSQEEGHTKPAFADSFCLYFFLSAEHPFLYSPLSDFSYPLLSLVHLSPPLDLHLCRAGSQPKKHEPRHLFTSARFASLANEFNFVVGTYPGVLVYRSGTCAATVERFHLY